MKTKTLFGMFLLAAAACQAASLDATWPAGSVKTKEDANAAVEAAKAERAELARLDKELQASCAKKFLVNDCIADGRKALRARRVIARRVELEGKDWLRVDDDRRATAKREANRSKRMPPAPIEVIQRDTPNPEKAVQTEERRAKAAERAANSDERIIKSAERQEKYARDHEDRERKAREKAAAASAKQKQADQRLAERNDRIAKAHARAEASQKKRQAREQKRASDAAKREAALRKRKEMGLDP